MVTKDGEPIKILLADDDEDDRLFFDEALKAANPNTLLKTVEDGEKLMKYLAEGNYPDIIFLDINMPCKNGIECLQEIRSNRKLDEVPVIMFSTSSYKVDIEDTFEKGANLYVSKPVFVKDHIKILKKIFAMNFQNNLLKRNKKRFVLHAGEI